VDGTADRGALAEILADAARGVFPPPDGSVTVVPQPSARDAGVLALAAHAVVFTDEDPAWLLERIRRAPGDPLAAPLSPAFLADLSARPGRTAGCVDLLTAAGSLPGPPPLPLAGIGDPGHPRVARALLFRDEVRVWAADGGVVVLGRGVAGRWEAAIEVDERARGRGLGRALALAARHLAPPGAVVWAQQAPGNAPSVRAFQAAGYRPVGGEVLLEAAPSRPPSPGAARLGR
jgi:GNAT superfamily N-acetyltransferase